MSKLRQSLKYSGILIIIFGTILFCAILGVNFSTEDMCGNTIHNIYPSPDKSYEIVIFQRDCGATTGFSTQISIIKNGEKLPNKSGNVFTAKGHPDDHPVKVTWTDNTQLTIHENFSESYLRNTMVNGVRVSYKN